MVGEIRDPETAEIAVRAALTGHLVLSSIHTNDAPSALTRLIDMDVAPYVTSSALLGVVAQRLVRRAVPALQEAAEGPGRRRLIAGRVRRRKRRPRSSRTGPSGATECFDTGYRGRIGLFEIMPMDDDLQRLFLHGGAARPAPRGWRSSAA